MKLRAVQKSVCNLSLALELIISDLGDSTITGSDHVSLLASASTSPLRERRIRTRAKFDEKKKKNQAAMTTVGSATSTKLQTVNHSRRSEFEGSRHRGYSKTFFEQWPVGIRLRSISVTRLSNSS